MTNQEPLIKNQKFLFSLGQFHAVWSAVDTTVECAIGRLLGVSDQEAQILTNGMQFGGKTTLLRELVKKSDHPRKSDILKAINWLQNDSIRNGITHSYIGSNETLVTFFERSRGGNFKVKPHTYTLESWERHVADVVRVGNDLHVALGYTYEDINSFLAAAIRAIKSD